MKQIALNSNWRATAPAKTAGRVIFVYWRGIFKAMRAARFEQTLTILTGKCSNIKTIFFYEQHEWICVHALYGQDYSQRQRYVREMFWSYLTVRLSKQVQQTLQCRGACRNATASCGEAHDLRWLMRRTLNEKFRARLNKYFYVPFHVLTNAHSYTNAYTRTHSELPPTQRICLYESHVRV